MVPIEGNGNAGDESFFFRLRGGRLPAFFEVRLGFGERKIKKSMSTLSIATNANQSVL